MRNCNEDSEKGYILKVDGKYPKEQLGLSSDMPFSPDKMKINKFEKVVCNLLQQEKLFHAHESSKAGAKPWIDIRKEHR